MENERCGITQYALVTAPGDTELVTMVNKAIEMGFQPFGNLIAVPNQRGSGTIIQPIVKYAEPAQ